MSAKATKIKGAKKLALKSVQVVPIQASVLGMLGRHEVAAALSISVRTLDVMRSNGEFPEADKQIGSSDRWSVELFNEWVRGQTRTRKSRAGRPENFDPNPEA